jgi:serine/threonine-protein kinase
MTQLSQGDVLGRYELLLPVARGGMAEVWAARLHGSRGFTKLVALKTILPGAIDSSRMEQMFLAEAELASRIQHPNVVQTQELGEHDGLLYIVLEWVEGESLSALLSQSAPHGGVPLWVGVNIIGQACKGLHAAHQLTDESGELLGVVHRDISPQNVLVNFSGTVKVVDFGIAKATQSASNLTEAGEVKGKLAYMAPEQLRGADNVDRRADIFSMGTLLYAMTTGKHPFRGDHPGVTLKNISARAPVPPPSSHVEDYPAALESVVLKALRKDPEQRFSTALEMLQALEQAMPEALERSFDVKVAEFVSQIAGTGAHRRKQQIKEAGSLLDLRRIKSGTSLEPTSASSLSALAIDGRQQLHTAALRLQPSLQETAGSLTRAAPSKRWPRALWALGGGAVCLGTVLGLVLAQRQPDSAVPNGVAAGVSVADAAPDVEAQDARKPKAGRVEDNQATEPGEEPNPTSEDSSKAKVKDLAESKARAQPRRVVARRIRPRTVPAPATQAPSAGEPAEAPPATPALAPTKPAKANAISSSDAWDPSSFGSRQ